MILSNSILWLSPFGLASPILSFRVEPEPGTPKPAPKNLNEEMRFYNIPVCPGSSCPVITIAEGMITKDSVKKFSDFKKTEEGEGMAIGKTVCFNSLGGDIGSGIALGREIRKRGLNTCILKYYSTEDPEGRVTLLTDNVVCLSACTYAFLGGRNREIEPGAIFGVHSIGSEAKEKNLDEMQGVLLSINSYLDEMGIDRHLVDIATSIPSSEKTRNVSADSLKQLQVLNDGLSGEEEWKIDVNKQGVPYAFIKAKHPEKKYIDIGMSISRQKNSVIFTLRLDYRLTDKEDLARLSEIYGDGIGNDVELSLDNENSYPPKARDLVEYKNAKFSLYDNAAIIKLVLPNSFVKNIFLSKTLDIDVNMANADSYYNPSMTIPLTSISNLLKVVLR